MLKEVLYIINTVIIKSTELCDLHYENNSIDWMRQSIMSLSTVWMGRILLSTSVGFIFSFLCPNQFWGKVRAQEYISLNFKDGNIDMNEVLATSKCF